MRKKFQNDNNLTDTDMNAILSVGRMKELTQSDETLAESGYNVDALVRETQKEFAQQFAEKSMAENTSLNTEWMGQYANLFGSPAESIAAQNQIVGDVIAYTEARKALSDMGKTAVYDLGAMQDYARKYTTMSEQEIQQLKENGDGLKAVSDASLQFDLSGTLNTMAANLRQTGDEADKALADFFEGLANSVSQGTSLLDQSWDMQSLGGFLYSSGYGANLQRQQHVNSLLQLAMSSSGAEEFMKSLSASNEDWIRDGSKFSQLLEGAGLTDTFAKLFTTEEITDENGNTITGYKLNEGANWDEFIRAMIASSSYNGLIADTSYNDYMSQLDTYAGGNIMGALSNGTFNAKGFADFLANPENEGLKNWIESLDGGKDILNDLAIEGDKANSAMKQFHDSLLSKGIQAAKRYGDSSEQMSQSLVNLRKNANSAMKEMGGMTKAVDQAYDLKTASQKMAGKTGKQLDKTTKGIIQEAFGISEQEINQMGKDAIQRLGESMASAADESFTDQGKTIVQGVLQSLQESLGEAGTQELAIQRFIDYAVDLDTGDIDMSKVAELASQLDNEALATLASFAQDLGILKLNVEDGDDYVHAFTEFISKVSGSVKGGGSGGSYRNAGGGGGGGKSAIDKLLQEMKNKITLADHRIKMTQIQEAKYEQRDEIENVNNMLEYENILQRKKADYLDENIKRMRQEISAVKQGSDDWQKLYDALLQAEEQYDEVTNKIYENTKKIKENHKAVLQARVDIESQVDKGIRDNIQRQRDMLDARVQMEENILNAIKQRHQDEWELIEKGVEKEKEALEKKKSLINEELQKRKEASEEGKKAEELAEYQRQLALISMDPTRTKEQRELQKKINDLNEEMGWKIAEREAESSTQEYDDQIKAMDEYLQHGREDLDYLLQDANNFAIEVGEVMAGSQKQILDWLSENVKEYKFGLDDAKKQMINSWTDTYKAMKGIFDKFIEEIARILSSEEAFIAFMKTTREYQEAPTKAAQDLLEQNWREGFQKTFVSMPKDDAEYTHSDPGIDGNFSGTTTTTGGGNGNGGGNGKGNDDGKNKSRTGNEEESLNKSLVVESKSKHYMARWNQGKYISGGSTNGGFLLESQAIEAAKKAINSIASSLLNNPKYANFKADINSEKNNILNSISTVKYKKGGLVDYTGFAWVDGTKANPEAFLSSKDRGLMRDLLDSGVMQGVRDMLQAFSRISVNTTMPNIFSGSANSDTKVSIGDINIHTEHINDQLDMENLATKIGEEFVKQLTASGIQTTRLAW